MNRLYRRFLVAIRDTDHARLTEVVSRHPDLHACARADVVWRLRRASLALLETAHRAGLHPDTGQRNDCSQTQLQQWAADGDLPALRLALRYGADPELRNEAGETALAYACDWGQLESVRALLAAGADVNAIEGGREGPPTTALDCGGTRRDPESAEARREIARLLRDAGGLTYEELQVQER